MVSETDNQKKLQSFFKDEYHSLKAYVNSKINSAADREAEDVIQDVALKMFSRADDLVPINNVAGFVYHAIKNKIIDVLRAKKEEPQPDENIETRFAEFIELFYGDVANNYSEKMIVALKMAIGRLKPFYQEVLIKIDFEGHSYKEVALETGISEGTLMSRRHRALGILYKELEQKKENTN